MKNSGYSGLRFFSNLGDSSFVIPSGLGVSCLDIHKSSNADLYSGLFGDDVAAFAGGDNHAGIGRPVFNYRDQRPGEESHFERFAVAIGNDNHVRILREVAERMGAANSLPVARASPATLRTTVPVSKESSESHTPLSLEINLRLIANINIPVKMEAVQSPD